MTSRTTRFCSIVFICFASTALGQLPDIRGLSFTDPHNRVDTIGGLIDMLGFAETNPPDPMTGQRGSSSLTPLAHTFDILPDPIAPADLGRIQLDTRLTFPSVDPVPACPLYTFSLTGTYDRMNGEIHLTGGKSGTHFYHSYRGPDPFGAMLGDVDIFIEITDMSIVLNGVLTDNNGVLLITGSDPYVPPGGPGNIGMAAARVFINHSGDCDPAHAFLPPLTVAGAYGGLYAWDARYVPEPASLTLAAAAALVIWGRRRRMR